MNVRHCMTVCLAAGVLTGCGAEAVGTAATGAVVKQQELEAGQAAQQRVQQSLQQGLDLGQQRAQQADDASR